MGQTGTISFVNLRTKAEDHVMWVKLSVTNVELLIDPVLAVKTIILYDRGASPQKFIIETDSVTIINGGSSYQAMFKMQKTKFPPGALIGVQEMRGLPSVGTVLPSVLNVISLLTIVVLSSMQCRTVSRQRRLRCTMHPMTATRYLCIRCSRPLPTCA